MSSNRTMRRTSPVFDDPVRGLEDAGGRIGRAKAARGQGGAGRAAVAREDEDGRRPEVQAEEDIVDLVPDHERAGKIEAELAGGPQAQAGERLGAGTTRRGRPRGGVGAGIKGIERGAAAGELLEEAGMEAVDLLLVEVAAA